jgi:hypothetical protein
MSEGDVFTEPRRDSYRDTVNRLYCYSTGFQAAHGRRGRKPRTSPIWPIGSSATRRHFATT